ncbi:MAG: MATE family efflux transporter [Bacteroidaceae bacterium]|nr:MATE family efflux transporter [Bacteroidaceae bacterium]
MAISKDELLLRIRQHVALSTGEQLRLVLMLSVPAILSQLSTILMFYIDDAMVGSLGAEATASIGLVATSLWLFWSVISCISTGFSVQVAHLIGADDLDGARSVFRQSIATSVALSVLVALVGVAVAFPLPRWLGGDETINGDATLYFLIFCAGAPMAMLEFISGSMLRSAGNIKVPSIANMVMCILDVVFNFFLIFPSRTVSLLGTDVWIPGFGLGVTGAAIGTISAEAIVSGYLMWYAVSRCPELRLLGSTGSFSPQRKVLRRAYDISWPILLQRVAMNAAQIVTTIIVAPLGAVAIAANTLGITAESLCYMPGFGIGEAATTLVGQSVGAKRWRLTSRFAWMTTLLGIVTMTFMGVLMYMAAPLMMASLTPDAAVRALGTECLRIEAWAEPMFAASIVAMSVFVGAGDTKKPALMNLISIWAVRITLAAALAPSMGLHGVWIAMAIELTFRGLIFLARMQWGHWMKISRCS